VTAFFGVLELAGFLGGAIAIEGTKNTDLDAGLKNGCYLGRLELIGQSGRGIAAKVVVYSKETLKLRHVCVQSTNSTLRSRESLEPLFTTTHERMHTSRNEVDDVQGVAKRADREKAKVFGGFGDTLAEIRCDEL